MSRKIISCALTDLGRKRTENEDNFVWVKELWGKPSATLLGAIDGVGGYEGGAEAALIAKQTIEEYLQNFSFGAPLQLLKEAIINANNNIHVRRATHPDLSRMSCVLSVAVLDAEKEMMYIGHVGDSRGYVYRNGQMLKVTKDHSVVGMKEDNGFLTEEEAMQHPRRNEISKMLGEVNLTNDDPERYIEMSEHSFLPGDIALFCSDGLTDLVNKADMSAILSQPGTLRKKAQSLIARANDLGGKDNITVTLAGYNAPKKQTGKKADNKNIIEVPIIESDESETITNALSSKRSKKKVSWVLYVGLAALLGFAANWWGTRSWLNTPVPVPLKDTVYLRVDSLGKIDTLWHDTLINATDTIYKNSSKDSIPQY
ncbi:MAG: protein phosphatase 2C domain-containing protein [Niabella sp.]